MIHDEDGVRWMFTGDEAEMDKEGYIKITGRIKDLIIRGGENIRKLASAMRCSAYFFDMSCAHADLMVLGQIHLILKTSYLNTPLLQRFRL